MNYRGGKMRYIITGGTGLIGSALSEALVAAGDQVVVLSRNPEKAHVPAGVEVVRWDTRSSNGWVDQLEGADGVINLAAESIGVARWSAEQKQRLIQSRVNAGAAIVEAVNRVNHKPEVVLQINAVGYYGIKADEVITEKDPPGNDFLANVAERWENTTLGVQAMGVRRVIVRSGVVLEKNHGMLPKMMLPFRLFIGGPLGSGKQWISWIHLDDLIQGMVYVLKDRSARGVYNLTSPEPMTNAAFCKILGKVMHRPYWIPAPGFVLKLALGEMSTLVLSGQRVIPARLAAEGFRFRHPGLEEALRDLIARV
jgi:uncharacterized protein (TIGR01777 family)